MLPRYRVFELRQDFEHRLYSGFGGFLHALGPCFGVVSRWRRWRASSRAVRVRVRLSAFEIFDFSPQLGNRFALPFDRQLVRAESGHAMPGVFVLQQRLIQRLGFGVEDFVTLLAERGGLSGLSGIVHRVFVGRNAVSQFLTHLGGQSLDLFPLLDAQAVLLFLLFGPTALFFLERFPPFKVQFLQLLNLVHDRQGQFVPKQFLAALNGIR